MKRLGQLLMLLGLIVGSIVGLAMIAHVSVGGLPFLVAIGLAKLTLGASAGLMTGGAVLVRISKRHEEAPRLPAPPEPHTPVP